MQCSEKIVALKTILSKEIKRFLRIWIQTILPAVMTMSLYFLIFGHLIGSQITAIKGFTYMQFIVPGLIMMAVITNSYVNVCFSFFNSKFQKSIEELLISPTPNSVIIGGYVLGGIARGLIVGSVVLVVALFFTKLEVHDPWILLFFAILTATVFSLGGLANAIFSKKFDDINIIPTFILTPLTYLGGVFYSVDQLPAGWRQLSLCNPILYMVNGFRYGFLGFSDVSLRTATLLLIALCGLLYAANLWFLQKGLGLRT